MPGDADQSGSLDISDGVALLRFLFLGGPPHHFAVPGNETGGCANIFSCLDRPGCP